MDVTGQERNIVREMANVERQRGLGFNPQMEPAFQRRKREKMTVYTNQLVGSKRGARR